MQNDHGGFDKNAVPAGQAAERATAIFSAGYNCSQAVLGAFAGAAGLDAATAARLAAGFGGGIGRTGNVCGAVTGAIMALGLVRGAATADREAKERMHALVRDFLAAFQARHKTLTCRELLGCDISTAEGMEAARQQGRLKSVCPLVVGDAAEIVEALLATADMA